jgi:hypothetical protein
VSSSIKLSDDIDSLLKNGNTAVANVTDTLASIKVDLESSAKPSENTFVLRAMSDEIASVRFSSTSPTKHFVRISLGALAGIAIGLSGMGTGSGLSAAGLAFLAGYAVEPVFATFDAIAKTLQRRS